MSLTVSLTNSNPSVGTVPTSVTITGGSDNATAPFTPVSVGETTISVLRPAGYALPTNNTNLTARVN